MLASYTLLHYSASCFLVKVQAHFQFTIVES